MRPRYVLALAAVVVVVAGTLWYLQEERSEPTSGIRVAVILSLNGQAARYDAIKRAAIELALERVRGQHPTLPLELRLLDAGGAPETVDAAIRRALAWKARYILTGTSPNALAVAALVRGRKPPVVQIANAANPDFGPPRPGEYRFWPDWKQEAQLVAALLREQGYSSVLIIHSADPYSTALTAAFRNLAAGTPPISVADLPYDPAETPDFRPALTRAMADNTDAIVVFGLPPGIGALMSQLADVGWRRAIIGGVNTNLAVGVYDSLGLEAPLWAVETEAMSPSLKPGTEAAAFRGQYVTDHQEPPPFHALYLADAVYFIAAAWLQNPDPSLDEVARVNSVRTFDGASGHIEISSDGILQFVMSTRRVR